MVDIFFSFQFMYLTLLRKPIQIVFFKSLETIETKLFLFLFQGHLWIFFLVVVLLLCNVFDSSAFISVIYSVQNKASFKLKGKTY